MTRRVDVPVWGLWAARLAPPALVGGWLLGDLLSPGFSSIRASISALAAHGTPHREVMTTGLALLGLCYLVTAVSLGPVRLPARAALAVGGAATLVIAASPLPENGPAGPVHGSAAGIALLSLAAWPALAADRSPAAPLVLRPAVAATAGLTMLLAVLWFGTQLHGSSVEGLAERLATGLEVAWPLLVVHGLRREARAAMPAASAAEVAIDLTDSALARRTSV